MDEAIFPYIRAKRAELQLAADQRTLLIFGVLRAHTTQKVQDMTRNNPCEVVFIHANMTHLFQSLDLTINGVAKSFIRTKCDEWYAKEIARQINAGVEVYSVEIKRTLSVLKQLHARRLIGLYDHLRNQPDQIKKGYDLSGIKEAISIRIETEDPFLDLDSEQDENNAAITVQVYLSLCSKCSVGGVVVMLF